jgi:hypothetical protein
MNTRGRKEIVMKRTSMAIVALLVLLSSTISFLAFAHASALDADISVDPATTTVTVSSIFTVDIIVTDVVALFGWQFRLHFDPAAVEVLDVTEGPFLMSGGTTNFARVIDNFAGYVSAGSILIVASPGVDGSGILAHVTFHCKGPTDTDLHFDEELTYFYDPAGAVIPTDKVDGYVQQLPESVIPEVPLGTIMASAAMIIALVAYVTMPKWRRKPI